MARKKVGKAQHKTLRLTSRAQFAVDLFSQLKGQSGNAFISECVEKHSLSIAKELGLNFNSMWHPSEPVRELRKYLLSDEDFSFSDEDNARRTFVLLHREFFYHRDGDAAVVSEHSAVELFPRIDEWRAAKGDHWAPGRAMAKHLKEQGITPPVWPPKDAK